MLKQSGLTFISPLPRASASEEAYTSISEHLGKAPHEAINNETYFERTSDDAIDSGRQPDRAPNEAIDAESQFEKVLDEAMSNDADSSKASDEKTEDDSQFVKAPDEVTNTGAPFEEVSDEATVEEATMETPPISEPTEAVELFNRLSAKLDSKNSFSVLAYGSGALVSLWISSAIVGAIDSVPLFPKVLEIIGLAYTVWFSYRYLIFKKNRDELSLKIEELKQQIIGSTND